MLQFFPISTAKFKSLTLSFLLPTSHPLLPISQISPPKLTPLQGIFAGTIGTRRLLKLFEKNNIKATWFIPGHTLDSFPEECAMIRDTGHEIGLHGYSHENPADMSFQQQKDVLDKTFRMLTDFCGKPPRECPSIITPHITSCPPFHSPFKNKGILYRTEVLYLKYF